MLLQCGKEFPSKRWRLDYTHWYRILCSSAEQRGGCASQSGALVRGRGRDEHTVVLGQFLQSFVWLDAALGAQINGETNHDRGDGSMEAKDHSAAATGKLDDANGSVACRPYRRSVSNVEVTSTIDGGTDRFPLTGPRQPLTRFGKLDARGLVFPERLIDGPPTERIDPLVALDGHRPDRGGQPRPLGSRRAHSRRPSAKTFEGTVSKRTSDDHQRRAPWRALVMVAAEPLRVSLRHPRAFRHRVGRLRDTRANAPRQRPLSATDHSLQWNLKRRWTC